MASEPEEPLIADEPPRSRGRAADRSPRPPSPPGRRRRRRRCSPPMPAGVEVGTFVHRVLEATDFAAPDLDAELAGAGRGRPGPARGRRRRPAAAGRPGCGAVIETPLGPVLGGRAAARHRARRPSRRARLRAAPGGRRPAGGCADAAADRRRAARPPGAGGPARRLRRAPRRPAAAPERPRLPDREPRPGGARLAGPAGAPRFAVARLQDQLARRPRRAADRVALPPEALAGEMQRHHYALQALLYAVALHRYLRWRLPGYDPDRHLAGVRVPVRARDDRRRTRRRSTGRRAASSAGGRRRPGRGPQRRARRAEAAGAR